MGSKFFRRSLLAVSLLGLTSVPALALKINIVVDKVSQHMRVSLDGVNTYNWLVSTGGPGYDTPTGTYNIFRLEKVYFSKQWDNAPMPNSMFFTPRGHAIHGSLQVARLGTRASHGCVRLAPENAAILFELVKKAGYRNSVVTIKGGLFDFDDSKNVVDAGSDGTTVRHRSFLEWLNGKSAKPVTVAQDVPAAAPTATIKKKKKIVKPPVAATTTTEG